MSFGFRATDEDLFKYIFEGDQAKLAKHLRRHPSAAKNAKVTLTHQEKDLVYSPLHFAISCTKSTEIVDILLDNGVDINEEFQIGSALCFAAFNGKTEIVRLLLRRGARLGLAGPDGYNDLHGAACNGHREICKVLLEHGADINSRHPITEDSPLSYAAGGGHHAILRDLLEEGANIDNRAWTGFTPLAVACQNNHLANVVSLLKAGADAGLGDNHGAPPIHKAAQRDHHSVLKVLLEHGCDKEQVRKN